MGKSKFAKLEFPKATRKVAVNWLKQGKEFKTVEAMLTPFSDFEKKLYADWHQEMRWNILKLHIDPGCKAYEYIQNIPKDRTSILKLASACNKSLGKQIETEGYPGRMLKLLKYSLESYVNHVNQFRKCAGEYIENLDMDGLKKMVKKQEEQERQSNEDKLFQRQILNHLLNLQKLKQPLPLDLMKRALATTFSDDPKTYDKQVIMVCGTEEYPQDRSLLIRQMCLDFIRNVMVNVRPDARLIAYLFKGGFLTREPYEVLIALHDCIKAYSMGILVVRPASEYCRKAGLDNKTEAEMNELELLMLGILKKYGPL